MIVRPRGLSRHVVALLWAAIVSTLPAALVGCAPVVSVPQPEVVPASISRTEIPAAIQAEIDRLLTANNLHASGVQALTWDDVLDTSRLGVSQYVDVSKLVGLDLAAHMGQSATWYTIGLRERSRSESGTSTASFVVVDGQVVGAGLHLWNYYPGVFALNDHSEVATTSSP